MHQGKITLIDEIHTPDSSRYFYAEGYEDRQKKGERQKQLSKEFVREWLIAHKFQGLEGQEMPEIPDDFTEEITKRYIELYEKISGSTFVPRISENMMGEIETNIASSLKQHRK